MTSFFGAALLLLGASGIYLYVVAWSFRASRRQSFSFPWLLLPLGGALLAGVTLALSVPASPSSPVSLRLLEVLAHCCVILLLWVIVGKIAPAYRLAGTCLYAWNPLALIELAMYANTAGVVTCLLLLAVLVLLLSTPSSSFAGIIPLVLVGLAMRINFMTLLLAPLLIWFMVRHRRGVGAALMGFAWRALVALGVFVVAFLPGWRGIETFLAITNGLRLFDFANSPLSLVVAPTRAFFKFVAERAHFPPLMQPDVAANMTVLATAFFLFALLYFREMGRVRARIRLYNENRQARHDTQSIGPARPVGTEEWVEGEEEDRVRGNEDRHKAPTHPPIHPLSLQDVGDDVNQSSAYDALFTGWAVVIVGYVVLAATVFVPGYLVWGVWVVALRRFDTLSVRVLLLSCSALLYYPLQWFALASMGPLLPLCVFGIPLAYLVVQYCLPAGRMERKKVLR